MTNLIEIATGHIQYFNLQIDKQLSRILSFPINNDIATYDVYPVTTSTLMILKAGLATASLTDVAVTNNTYYYWKVITKDSKGNTSDSGTYRFKVN